MSSISASDRKNQTDEVRNQREDYQTREAEEAKRHKKEIKRLLERQDQEIAELKDSYSKQMDTISKRSSEQLSDRDLENQAKIDKLRAMYVESLKKKSEETDARHAAEAEANKSMVTKERQISNQQKEGLTRNFENTIKDKDRQFEALNLASRQEMKDSITRQNEKLTEKHGKEMNALVEDRDENLAQAYRDMKNSKSMYENRLKQQQLQGDEKLTRTNSNWKNTYDGKTRELSELLDGKGKEVQLERQKMQVHFDQALEKKAGVLDEARETLKEEAMGRIDRDVRSLEGQNSQLKNDHVVEMMTTKRLRDLEKEHLVMAYEERMQNLASTKDGLVDAGKEINRRKIEQAVQNNENILSESNRRNRTQQIISNERHKADRDQLEVETNTKLRQVGDRTQERVDKLMKATNDAQRMEQKQHTENVGALKNSYSEELSNQRMAQMEQLKDTYVRMDDKVKSSEEKMQKKLDETVSNYETRLAQTEEKYQKELKKQNEAFLARSKARDKAVQMELKSGDIKTNLKLGQQEEIHEKEIDRLQKRHQEEMASLAQKLSYYRKSNT